MTDFAFENITAAQAMAFTAADRLTVAAGTASQTTVLFVSDGTIALSIGSRTVIFAAELGAAARAGGIAFADQSQLYVGGASQDVNDLSFGKPGTGAMYGGDGGDFLTSSAGAWLMQGNQGNDQILVSSLGSNTVYGGQGDDSLGVMLSPGAQLGQFAQGNRGNDSIGGTNVADTLLGGQGDDRISGNDGQDFLNGNLGDDLIFGVGQLLGEGGRDTLNSLSSGSSTARGGDGDDRITATYSAVDGVAIGGRNLLMGELGADTIISASPDHDEILGGDGDDLLSNANVAASAGDLMDGGEGQDTLVALLGDDTLAGGAGNDSLNGGAGANRADGGDGDDYLTARGQFGASLLDGGVGNDTLLSGTGTDTLAGGEGNDSLNGRGPAGSLMDGGGGDDRISVSDGTPLVRGGDGRDTIDSASSSGVAASGGEGNDSLRGSSAADTLAGDAGNDTLFTNGGADVVRGEAGNDSLLGGSGAETLSGGDGADTIDGGGGVDWMSGGAGADTYLVLNGSGPPQPGTAPQIRDWSSDDFIQFRDAFAGAAPRYVEYVADDFAGAVTFAQSFFAQYDNAVAAVQLGGDVIVFSGRTAGVAIDAAVVLVGRSLNDISAGNMI